MNKNKALLELAKKRKSHTYDGYTAVGDYNNGDWDCNYVSPISKSSHNADSKILVFLQDWASEDDFTDEVDKEINKLGYDPKAKTNKNLKQLLSKYFKVEFHDIYITNLFPFIKCGSASSQISSKDLIQAAKDFSIPMVNIIQPTTVICFGVATFDAMRRAHLDCKKTYKLSESFENTFSIGKSKCYCQAHPALRGKTIDSDIVVDNWKKMAASHNRAIKRSDTPDITVS